MITSVDNVDTSAGEDHPLNSEGEENYTEIFQQCDKNNDGKICIKEFNDFIVQNAEKCKSIPKDVIFKIHRIADKDGDKQLNYDEFVNLLRHRRLQDLLHYQLNRYVNFMVPLRKLQPASEQGPFQLMSSRKTVDSSESQNFYDYYNCIPPPLFIITITVFEIAYFFIDHSNGKELLYDPSKRNEFWRFITYVLVHVSIHHLIVNMLVQVFLGIPLEMVHKWWRVMIIYITGGIGGSMLHSIGDRKSRLAGASGSVYAIMTAHVANVIMNWGQMQFPYIQLIFFGFLAFYDLGYSIYDHYFLNIPTNVGILAHLGGAMSGMLVGIYILRNIQITSLEKYIWWIALTLYIIFVGTVIIINIFVL